MGGSLGFPNLCLSPERRRQLLLICQDILPRVSIIIGAIAIQAPPRGFLPRPALLCES